MFHYKLKLAYKGGNYSGWQSQGAVAETERRTVQGSVHQVLRRISDYQECSITGTSRTDTGVHARAQVGKASIPIEISSEKLRMGMNSLLPADIRVLECERCDDSFNPQTFAKGKEYHYYFHLENVANPLIADIVSLVSHNVDLPQMREAARLFEGVHDFSNFCRRTKNVATTTRHIHSCELRQANLGPLADEVYFVRIVGAGFLKYMVRYIVGALVAVGEGAVSPAQIVSRLREPGTDKLAPKADAKGLHLIDIF